jgi:hypothetical protein
MWTKKSYDAIYLWLDYTKHDIVRKIMIEDGLDSVVKRLDTTNNMQEWYKITIEAVAFLGFERIRSWVKI